jgi:hypothetical protein
MVVGWGTNNILRASLDDKQVTILNTGDELDALTALFAVDGGCQFTIQIIYELGSILGLQVAAIMGNDFPIGYADDVTAQGQVVIGHLIAYAGCLKGTPPFIDLTEVVTQNGGVGHLRPRGEPFGNGDEPAAASLACQTVHHGFVGSLQGSASLKAGNGVVCHAVA